MLMRGLGITFIFDSTIKGINLEDASEKKIASLMVGSETQKVSPKKISPGKSILSFNGVSVVGRSKRDSLNDVNLNLKSHEILGIAGISGNGQNVLADLISGLVSPDKGSILLKGTAKPTSLCISGLSFRKDVPCSPVVSLS